VKASWTVTALGDVATIRSGGSLKLSGKDFVEDGVAAWGAGGHNGYVSAREAEGPAVILSSIGARCGKCFYVDGEWTTLANTQIIVPHADRVDARFLWYQLNDERRWPRSGSGQPFIKPSDVKAHEIVLPPLAEQRRITAVLDLVDQIRASRRRSCVLVRDLIRSCFVGLFGDPQANPLGFPIGTIGDIVESTDYGSSAKANASGRYPILRMGNITSDGQIDLTDLKYLDLPGPNAERYLLRRNDVLFNRTNSADLVGKAAVYRGPEPMAYAGYLIRVRMGAGHAPDYLSGFLNSRYGKRLLRKLAKNIIGMANINAKELRSIRIPVPPQAMQQRFATIVSGIGAREEPIAAHLNHLDGLFAALQDRAFNGEL
jgi:type I restriction enzyme S subunit